MASESILGDVTIPALVITLLAICATVVALLLPKRWPPASKDEDSKPLSEDELIRELEGSTGPKAKQKRRAKPKAGRAEPIVEALQEVKAQEPPRSGSRKVSKPRASPAANPAEEVAAVAPPQEEKARPEPPPAAAEQALPAKSSETVVPKPVVPSKAGSKKTSKVKEVTAEAPPQEETARPQPPPAAAEQARASKPAEPVVPAHPDPEVAAELKAVNGKTRSKDARASDSPCAVSPEEAAAAEDLVKPPMPSDAPADTLAIGAAGNEQQAEAGCATGTVKPAPAKVSEATCHIGKEAKEKGSQPRSASATGAPARKSKGPPAPARARARSHRPPSPARSKPGAQEPQGVLREVPRTAVEREILKWGKKSREVQELRRRLDEGEDLDPHQRDKVARGQEIADKLAALQVERDREIEEAAAEQKRAAEPALGKEEPAAEAAEVEPAQPATGKVEPAAEAAAKAAQATAQECEVQQLKGPPNPKAELAPAKVEPPAEVAAEVILAKAQEGKVRQPDVTPKPKAGTTKKASKAKAKAWATLPRELESAPQDLPAEEPLHEEGTPPDIHEPPAAAAPKPQEPAVLAPTPPEPAAPKTTAATEDVAAAKPLQEVVTPPGVPDPPSEPAPELPEPAVPALPAELAAPMLPEEAAMPSPEPLEPAALETTAALEAAHDKAPAGDDPAGPEVATAAEDDAAPAAGPSAAPAPTPAAEGEGCPAGAAEPDAAEALCHEGDDATGVAAAPEVVGRPPERDKGRTSPEESRAEAEAADTTDAVDDDFIHVSSAKVRGQKPKPRAPSSERQSRATEAPTTSRQRAAPAQPGARSARSPAPSPGKRTKPGSWVIGMGPPPPNRPKPGAKAGEPPAPPPDLVARTTCEKEILKLEKKVKEIQSLQQRLDDGGDLDAAQREKVARGPEILERLDAMRQQRLMEIEGEAEARAARAKRAEAPPHPQAASPSPHGLQANAASFFPAGIMQQGIPFTPAGHGAVPVPPLAPRGLPLQAPPPPRKPVDDAGDDTAGLECPQPHHPGLEFSPQGACGQTFQPMGFQAMPMGLPMQSPPHRLKHLDYTGEDSVRLACPQPYHPGLETEAEYSPHSPAFLQMGAMGQMAQMGYPSPMEASMQGRWDACWEWVQHGWCPRGRTCRWDHPMMTPMAYSAPVAPTMQYWAPGEEGLQYQEDYADVGSYMQTCQPVGEVQQQAAAGGE